jgi:hypothetical protein
MDVLVELPLVPTEASLPQRALELIDEGLKRSKLIDCFDFVSSDSQAVWQILDALPRGRFCEWGSGIGIVTAMAELLEFEAMGIELHPELAAASRKLLEDFGLKARIEEGDYFETFPAGLVVPPASERFPDAAPVTSEAIPLADVYFTYCWPGKIYRVEDHFAQIAQAARELQPPRDPRILIYHGTQDIRCEALPG